VFERLLRERALVGGERRVDGIDGRADPEPEIGCHLIVARARGMQPPGRRPDQLGQARLDVHVNVFKLALEFELARFDL
jgi:hypothetical protein